MTPKQPKRTLRLLRSRHQHCNGFMFTLVLLLYIFSNLISSPAAIKPNVNSSKEDNRDQRFNLHNDHTLVIRLPSNPLLKYTSYKDVSILHFKVPADTRTAYFKFRGNEESKSAFQRKCKPQDISLHLKASSYPVISPENITFPKTYLNSNERFQIHTLQFTSDESEHSIQIDGPQLGNWFITAFVSWSDPNNDPIEQQGLSPTCETLLSAELIVQRVKATIITSAQEVTNNLTYNNKHRENGFPKSLDFKMAAQDASIDLIFTERIYKFFVPSNIGNARVNVEIKTPCLKCPPLGLYVRSNAVPVACNTTANCNRKYINDDLSVYSRMMPADRKAKFIIKLNLQPNQWHYACLRFVAMDTNGTMLFQQSVHFSNTEHAQKFLNETFLDNIDDFINYSLKISFMENDDNELNNNFSDDSLKNNVNKNPNNNYSKNNGDILFGQLNNPWTPIRFRDMSFYPLLRQSYREFFMFDYDLIPDENGTVPSTLNLTAGMPVGFAFQVGEIYDIGGTLSFAVSMNHALVKPQEMRPMDSNTERSGILAERLTSTLIDKDASRQRNEMELISRRNQTIIVCMHLREPGQPTWPDKCRYGDRFLPATTIVNNTDPNTSTGLIHVPFPESGIWYVTMGLYCHGAETTSLVTLIDSVKDFVVEHVDMLGKLRTTCVCLNSAKYYQNCLMNTECLAALNETEILRIKECLMDPKCTDASTEMTRNFENRHRLAIEQQFALDNCNASVIFTVSSSPCVAGRCGRYGRCYHYMSGGFVFSTCVCMKGYRGWDCSNDEHVPTKLSVLVASLLLTFSNLFFLPSIFIATRRKYFTEATIYFSAMFFSIFYHACDSGEDEYSFCLVKISVLQFCDFYCGLLAIWVTLVAMSGVRTQFVSQLHMMGAILLAFGTELNKQALWVFLAPALTGICIISVSWGLHCYHSQKLFPARRYLQLYMPLGTVLVMIGLICYAFLQTKQNYHIVHSIWHMLMALSILCLLPSRKSFIPKC